MILKIKITKCFLWASKQYYIDVKEVLGLIRNRETFREGEKLMEFHNRSLTFTKEFHFLKIYLSGGMDFYDALALAFEDPIMSYIISYEDLECLFDYLDKKSAFWSSYVNKHLYTFTVVIVTISCSLFIKYIFPVSGVYIFSILLYYILIVFLGYVVATCSVFYIYKEHCNRYIFLQYFDHKISLTKLFHRKKSKDILGIITQLEQKKIYKKQTLLEKLAFRWRIIEYIPILTSFLAILIVLLIFLLNILRVFQYILTSVNTL